MNFKSKTYFLTPAILALVSLAFLSPAAEAGGNKHGSRPANGIIQTKSGHIYHNKNLTLEIINRPNGKTHIVLEHKKVCPPDKKRVKKANGKGMICVDK